MTRAAAAFYWPGRRAGPAPSARSGVPVNERRPAAPRWVPAPGRAVRCGAVRCRWDGLRAAVGAERGVSKGCREIQKVAKGCEGFQWDAVTCEGTPRAAVRREGIQRVAVQYEGMQTVAKGCKGFQWDAKGCKGMPRVENGRGGLQ